MTHSEGFKFVVSICAALDGKASMATLYVSREVYSELQKWLNILPVDSSIRIPLGETIQEEKINFSYGGVIFNIICNE